MISSKFRGWKTSLVREVRFPRPLKFALVGFTTSRNVDGWRELRVHGTLKESRSVHFFADSRDLTGCRYYVVGHCCRGPRFVDRFTPLLPTAEIRPPSSRTTLPVRRSDPPILYLLYRGDQSRRIPRACAARNERSPVLSVFPSVYPEDRSTGRPPCPLLGPFSWDLPSLPPAFVPRPPFSTVSARYSSLAWLPRYLISPLSTGTFVYIQIHAHQIVPFLRDWFFLFNSLDRGSVNENVAILYFGKSMDSFCFVSSIVSNSIKLPNIHERRYSCTYLAHSCNNVALLN